MTTNITNFTHSNMPAWVIYNYELTIWYKMMIFFSIIGTICNFFLVITILSSKKFRSGSGVLIANLHILVFMQCAFGMPMVFIPTYQVASTGPVSNLFCRGSFSLYFILLEAVDWADMMIGINRLVAICFPFNYAKWTTKPVLVGMIITSWAPSTVIGLCAVFNVGAAFRMILPWGSCGVITSSPIMLQMINVLGVLFPVATLGEKSQNLTREGFQLMCPIDLKFFS